MEMVKGMMRNIQKIGVIAGLMMLSFGSLQAAVLSGITVTTSNAAASATGVTYTITMTSDALITKKSKHYGNFSDWYKFSFSDRCRNNG